MEDEEQEIEPREDEVEDDLFEYFLGGDFECDYRHDSFFGVFDACEEECADLFVDAARCFRLLDVSCENDVDCLSSFCDVDVFCSLFCDFFSVSCFEDCLRLISRFLCVCGGRSCVRSFLVEEYRVWSLVFFLCVYDDYDGLLGVLDVERVFDFVLCCDEAEGRVLVRECCVCAWVHFLKKKKKEEDGSSSCSLFYERRALEGVLWACFCGGDFGSCLKICLRHERFGFYSILKDVFERQKEWNALFLEKTKTNNDSSSSSSSSHLHNNIFDVKVVEGRVADVKDYLKYRKRVAHFEQMKQIQNNPSYPSYFNVYHSPSSSLLFHDFDEKLLFLCNSNIQKRIQKKLKKLFLFKEQEQEEQEQYFDVPDIIRKEQQKESSFMKKIEYYLLTNKIHKIYSLFSNSSSSSVKGHEERFRMFFLVLFLKKKKNGVFVVSEEKQKEIILNYFLFLFHERNRQYISLLFQHLPRFLTDHKVLYSFYYYILSHTLDTAQHQQENDDDCFDCWVWRVFWSHVPESLCGPLVTLLSWRGHNAFKLLRLWIQSDAPHKWILFHIFRINVKLTLLQHFDHFIPSKSFLTQQQQQWSPFDALIDIIQLKHKLDDMILQQNISSYKECVIHPQTYWAKNNSSSSGLNLMNIIETKIHKFLQNFNNWEQQPFLLPSNSNQTQKEWTNKIYQKLNIIKQDIKFIKNQKKYKQKEKEKETHKIAIALQKKLKHKKTQINWKKLQKKNTFNFLN